MTLDQADHLLGQWAVWGGNALKRLGASQSSWQKDYRPPYDPDNPSYECEAAPNELEMLDVDTALGMVKATNHRHFFIIRSRYCHGEHFTHLQLDAAKRSFIAFFQSPIDTSSNLYENYRAGTVRA